MIPCPMIWHDLTWNCEILHQPQPGSWMKSLRLAERAAGKWVLNQKTVNCIRFFYLHPALHKPVAFTYEVSACISCSVEPGHGSHDVSQHELSTDWGHYKVHPLHFEGMPTKWDAPPGLWMPSVRWTPTEMAWFQDRNGKPLHAEARFL